MSDSPQLTLVVKGYEEGIRALFNALADAFWDDDTSLDTFVNRLGSKVGGIASVLVQKPEAKLPQPYETFAILQKVIIACTDAWVVRAGRHWEEREDVTGREARLREFCNERGYTRLRVATAANVQASELSRWARLKPGDKRYIPRHAEPSRRIEDVLCGGRPI